MFGKAMFATFYLSVGAITHTALIGTTFNPANPFCWACLFGWPVVLFVLLMLLGFACIGLVVLGCWLADLYADIPWVRRRRMRKVMTYVASR